MGEGESSSVSRRIQPHWKLRETGLAVPSPVGRERVRVRAFCLNCASCPTFVFAQTLRRFVGKLDTPPGWSTQFGIWTREAALCNVGHVIPSFVHVTACR